MNSRNIILINPTVQLLMESLRRNFEIIVDRHIDHIDVYFETEYLYREGSLADFASFIANHGFEFYYASTEYTHLRRRI